MKRIALVALALVVLAGAIFLIQGRMLGKPNSAGRYVVSVAGDLPIGAGYLVAAASPAELAWMIDRRVREGTHDELLQWLQDVAEGLVNVPEGAAEARAWLTDRGIAATEPVGASVGPILVGENDTEWGTFLSFGAAGGADAARRAAEGYAEIVGGGASAFSNGSGYTVDMAGFTVDDDRLLVFVLDGWRSETSNIERAIEAWLELEEEERWSGFAGLNELTDLDEPMAVTVVGDLQTLMFNAGWTIGGDVPSPLDEAVGLSFGFDWVAEDSIRVRGRLLATGSDSLPIQAIRGTAQNFTADLPGPIVAGITHNMDPIAWYEFAKELAQFDRDSETEFEFEDEFDEIFGVEFDDLLAALSGSGGIILDDWPRASSIWSADLLAWFGFSNPEVAEEMVDGYVDAIEEDYVRVDRDSIDGHTYYSFDDGGVFGMEQALTIASDSLFATTDVDLVEDLLERDSDRIFETNRAASRVLGAGAELAVWLDVGSLASAYDDELADATGLDDNDFGEIDGEISGTVEVRGRSLFASVDIDVDFARIAGLVRQPLENYRLRSLTYEATMNLLKLSDGSVLYYANHSGGQKAGQFPPSTQGSTPARSELGPGCDTPMRTQGWESSPTWSALEFGVADPHYFVYQYDSSGRGNESDGRGNSAQFTASAFGDLDCDRIYSTFCRFGIVEEGEVRGSSGIYISNELE